VEIQVVVIEGEQNIYIAGATFLFMDMALILLRTKLDLANILLIGDNTMDVDDAIIVLFLQ
jgi:hypothetical protein